MTSFKKRLVLLPLLLAKAVLAAVIKARMARKPRYAL
jgi:hypothetical protein